MEDQLPTLIAAALGGLIATIANILVTRFLARDAEKIRLAGHLHERRFEAYSEIALAAKNVGDDAFSKLIDVEIGFTTATEEDAAFEKHREELGQVLAKHVILVSSEVGSRVQLLLAFALQIKGAYSEGKPAPRATAEKLDAGLRRAVAGVVDALRSDLKAEQLTAAFHELLPVPKRREQKKLPP